MAANYLSCLNKDQLGVSDDGDNLRKKKDIFRGHRKSQATSYHLPHCDFRIAKINLVISCTL